MKAIASSLTVRFYTSLGWTQDILDSCVKWSPILTKEMIAKQQKPFYIAHPVDENPYFVYTSRRWATLDMDKLMEHVTELDRRSFNDYPDANDRDFIWRHI